MSKKNINDCMGDHKPRQRGEQVERTAPWVEPIQAPKPISTPQEPKPWTDNKEDKLPIRPKRKVKTKGVGSNVESQEMPAIEAPSEKADKQPTFKVDKAMLKVFNTLFFSPGQSGTPGEIPWIDFLRAMATTGFAAQKLYGSIWQFTPTNRT